MFVPENYEEHVRRDDMYAGLLTGDHARAAQKTVLCPSYARLYAENLLDHRPFKHLKTDHGVLDMGCGAGAITAAFHSLLGTPAYGIDMSPSAIQYASSQFRGPEFFHRSADDLHVIPDESLALVHARGFYPFCRSEDTDLHMRFLDAAKPKLVSGGIFAVVQVNDPTAHVGVDDSFVQLQHRARDSGYGRADFCVMVPQFFRRRFGRIGYLPGVYDALSLSGHVLEAAKPGLVSFIYWFMKSD